MNSNTKRIAKNTFFLYLRMGLLMLISLFTSRVLLDKLGVEDFGIFNVIGGMAAMFTFFSCSLANATQRFLNIELGQNNVQKAQQIFQQHFTLYLVIILGVILLGEPIGLWLIYNKLVIPSDRLVAAVWIFQFTLLSLAATFIGIVFNSEIVSHEDLKIYSYIGIVEGIAKLIICYVISISASNRLIVYGLLLMLVNLCVQGSYISYCLKKYDECKIKFIWNIKLLKETTGIVGWNLIGCAVWMINDSFMNLLLNMFFGPVVNAARAISYQINAALNNFTGNFFISLRPQLMKSYAKREYEYLHTLLYNSTRYSIYLMLLISFPIIFCIHPILNLWLKVVPDYTTSFSVLVLCISWVSIPKGPLWDLVLASGKIRNYQVGGSLVLLMAFPIAYVLLKMSFDAISVFYVLLIVRFIHYLFSVCMAKPIIGYSYKEYFLRIYPPIIRTLAISLPMHYLFAPYFQQNIWTVVCFICISLVANLMFVYLLGISKSEKEIVWNVIKKRLIK